MQTRSGFRYKKPEADPSESPRLKKLRPVDPAADFFSRLPDDLVISILCKLSFSASCPSDLISVLLICKRLNGLVLDPLVLSKASPNLVAIRAKNWSDEARRFLKMCADAGSIEACYMLGMIKFYCLGLRGSGASLMAKSAVRSHGAALYSLAIIQFNGSGGCRTDKDLRAGVALLARSASVGHVDALRELGHCLMDGYGVRRNADEGRRFLLLASANAQEERLDVPSHPANRFLLEWLELRGRGCELRACSHTGCGRPETRKHEFRRCSVCGKVNYCSRGCQAIHWKLVHKTECAPMLEQQQQMPDDGNDDDGDNDVGEEPEVTDD